ncbi:MAG: hypothetical protein JNJ58_03280 [Chitinophagaceae bacterium]|nr:hypothetical protein [Chitinophagaceae bacterium]
MIKISTGSLKAVIKSFFRKINSPYRLVVVNEETLNEALTLHLTKKSIYILFSGFLISIFLLFSALILLTPVKYYIPGYQSDISRKKLIGLQKLSDSLIQINQVRERYLLNLLTIANGQMNATLDTNGLSPAEIQMALTDNTRQIDKASNYEYLKNGKSDSLMGKTSVNKDTLHTNQQSGK